MNTVRILIADDHDVVREGLKTLLAARADFRVCGEAATGREAVARARELKPHVVVLDFSMPELNGLEATRQIRKALPDTEVLILTMHDSETLARQVLAAGAHGFLLKTHAKRQLVAAVDALAQHRPFFTGNLSALVLDAFLHPGQRPAKTGVPADRLTPREREVVQLIAEGRTSKDIALQLGLSVKTADAHRANVMRKLDLHSVSELVLYAVRNKIVQA
ncbi:MAG: response regulator transcription factor [Verrucomicrobia bacterium]|nr:response regulator transcription factor [Verrucomicrobiota bacterium]